MKLSPGCNCHVSAVRLPSLAGRGLIWIYRHTLSPLVGYQCRHLPTCSVYADEAIARWPLQGLTIIHRFGRIAPSENTVLVVTASSHRQAAFEAAEFLMDYLKTNAPFWKQEESARGTSWIEARDHDDAAAARWTKS